MEKELFGLRDKDGKEYKISVRKNRWDDKLFTEYIELIEPVKESKPLPEFKIHQWAAFETSYGERCIFYITKLSGNMVEGNYFYPEDHIYDMCRKQDLVSVTPQEIEAYLRKVLEARGYKDGTMINGLRFGTRGRMEWQTEEYNTTMPGYSGYYAETDTYNVSDSTNNVWEAVYKEGQFAEIIPDKKKLPKTKEELQNFLYDYINAESTPFDYIKEYED